MKQNEILEIVIIKYCFVLTKNVRKIKIFQGPKCLDTGLPCDLEHSTCEGRTQMCVAFGPGEDMYESTR